MNDLRPDPDRVARAQMAYWIFGGLWPLISMRSFERVTGNKRDEWLVRAVALLMLSVVATLETLREEGGDDRAMRVLGTTSAASLGAVAAIGALIGRISPVYVLDAVVDLVLAAAWLGARERR
jgi:hypothetical protein